MTDKTDMPEARELPLSPSSVIWILVLVFVWAVNSVVVTIVVRDIPPFFAAFFRFFPAIIIIVVFLAIKKVQLRVSIREFALSSIVGLLSAAQIFTFSLGARYTTGGRVTLFIFSYPFFVILFAPLLIKNERLNLLSLGGSIIAFIGLFTALYPRLGGGDFRGDLIELASAVILSFQVIANKKVMEKVNHWKVLVCSLFVASVLYLAGGLLFEKIDFNAVKPDAVAALVFQIIFSTTFSFLSWQYLLSRHSASKVSAFFFASPVFGMIVGIILLGEAFDPWLLAGCVLVGGGIILVQQKWGKKEK